MMKRETLLDWRRPLKKFGYYGPTTEQHRQVIDSHLEALHRIAELEAQVESARNATNGHSL